MLPIADTRTYQLSRFTIREQPRRDNPAWPQFLIFLDGKLIATQGSRPAESDCEWHLARRGEYSTSTRTVDISAGRPIWNTPVKRRGRPTNAERERRAAAPPEEEETSLA